MKKLIALSLGLLCCNYANAQYNTLNIPDTLSGTQFNLVLKDTMKVMNGSTNTITAAINNASFWGPTLMMNRNDSVFMNVRNTLNDSTTLHWHGMHLPAVMDGGPHQIIPPGTFWNPYWKVNQQAATLWYHPHLHEMAQKQMTLGLGGFIYIKDSHERSLALPRTYGVDDVPLAITSRKFTSANQFVTENAAYGDYAFINGTSNPQVSLPRQYVRLRLLNADIERSYNIGFSDNRSFYVIANDGGLLNAPVQTTRVRVMVGERYEIMVDLSNLAVGGTLDLKAYNTGQNALSFPGAENQTAGEFGSLLNARDFNLLRINAIAQTANPILSVPTVLNSDTYWGLSDVTNNRSAITVTGGARGGAFTLNNLAYGFNRIDQTVALDAIEKWTITNNNIFGHSFHLHDVFFKILSRTSGILSYEGGWKDSFYLPNGETVTFVAKFDDYADTDPDHPYMYHCHFANHEDEGMMGQFLVAGPTAVKEKQVANPDYFTVYPNPANNKLYFNFKDVGNTPYYMVVRAANGRAILMSPKPMLADGIDISHLAKGMYTIQIRDTFSRTWYTRTFVKQ